MRREARAMALKAFFVLTSRAHVKQVKRPSCAAPWIFPAASKSERCNPWLPQHYSIYAKTYPPRCPSADESIQNTLYRHIMKLY